MAMSPIDEKGISSNSDRQCSPPSVDFQRPPVAKPMYMIIGSFSAPTISSSRPIITAGPIDRKLNPLNIGSSEALTGIGGGAGCGGPCAKTNAPRGVRLTGPHTAARRKRYTSIMVWLPFAVSDVQACTRALSLLGGSAASRETSNAGETAHTEQIVAA